LGAQAILLPRVRNRPFPALAGALDQMSTQMLCNDIFAGIISSLTNARALEFVAHGPLEVEVSDWDSHKSRRDRTSALERDLYEAMARAGYRVLNKVDCLTPTDDDAGKPVRQAFAQRFDRLSTV
jgi:hypothetical protein